MLTLLLFVPAAILFMAINIILGCYIAIRLGYGPPNWQTALNQVVSLTTLQRYLNAGREWLERKVPKVDQFLTRLNVPKPITIIDTTQAEEGEEAEEEETGDEVPEEIVSEQTEALTDAPDGETTEGLEPEKSPEEPGAEQNAVPE